MDPGGRWLLRRNVRRSDGLRRDGAAALDGEGARRTPWVRSWLRRTAVARQIPTGSWRLRRTVRRPTKPRRAGYGCAARRMRSIVQRLAGPRGIGGDCTEPCGDPRTPTSRWRLRRITRRSAGFRRAGGGNAVPCGDPQNPDGPVAAAADRERPAEHRRAGGFCSYGRP